MSDLKIFSSAIAKAEMGRVFSQPLLLPKDHEKGNLVFLKPIHHFEKKIIAPEIQK